MAGEAGMSGLSELAFVGIVCAVDVQMNGVGEEFNGD